MSIPPDAIAAAVRTVKPFLAMEIFERAQELERRGIRVAHLEVGEPAFRVPACVEEAIQSALAAGGTHYTHSLGLYELREEIARYYERRYGVSLAPDRVIVTAGSSAALLLIMALLLEPGDEVLLPDPGYACYDGFVRTFRGTPRAFEVSPEDGWRYDPGRIRAAISPRTRAVLINSPSNPTAAIQDRTTLEELAGLGIPVISDEIYHGLEYGREGAGRATCLLETTSDGFVIDGFSKRFAMTGLRVGWLVAPERFVEPLQRLAQNLFVSTNSLAQHGAIAALRHGAPDVERMVHEYGRRRKVLLEGLGRLGFRTPCEPMGAYYILADARHLDESSLRLACRILEEAHVGTTPGIDFGPRAEGFLRFSFASSLETIDEALERLGEWLAGSALRAERC